MKFKFLHFADAHLRKSQYGHVWRGQDFRDAWLQTIRMAINHQVDFVTFAGDLFDRSEPGPVPFSEATEGLSQLKEMNIPFAMIKGNHDTDYPGQMDSWLDYMAEQKMITLLNSVYVPGPADDDLAEAHSFMPVKNVFVYGLPWYGAATGAKMMELSVSNIDAFRILLLHAGLEGVLPHRSFGSFPLSMARDLLYPHFDLILCGHVHKPFEADDKIFNGGSLEACNSQEAQWPGRGAILFEVDTEKEPKFTRTYLRPHNRPWASFEFDVTGKAVSDVVNEYATTTVSKSLAETIVVIRLSGETELSFRERDFLDAWAVKHLILDKSKVTRPVKFRLDPAVTSRQEIEQLAFEQLYNDPDLVQRIKELALGRAGIDKIMAVLKGA